MTVTANETALEAAVDVRFTPAGRPLAVRHEGQIWAVSADPVHWFKRDVHNDMKRAATFETHDMKSVEYWRVQVGLASNSALRTFTLRRDPRSSQWLLEAIADG